MKIIETVVTLKREDPDLPSFYESEDGKYSIDTDNRNRVILRSPTGSFYATRMEMYDPNAILYECPFENNTAYIRKESGKGIATLILHEREHVS